MKKWCSRFTAMLVSAKLALDHERAKAASPGAAILPFLRSQTGTLRRLSRLGLNQYAEINQLEVECAYAGFRFSIETQSNAPPWKLPDAFVNLTSSELPAHPTIDPVLFERLLSEQGVTLPSAITGLRILLNPCALSSRWAGVPRIGHSELPQKQKARVAVCLHLFYPEMWAYFREALKEIPEPWDLYVTVPNFSCNSVFAGIAIEHPATRFLPCSNRGRDVLPFLKLLNLGVFDGYDAVCKLHTKRSPHMRDGSHWLSEVMSSLLGSSSNVLELLQRFRRDPKVGLIGPKSVLISQESKLHSLNNRKTMNTLLQKAELPVSAAKVPFFAGTMFWFRPTALGGLRALTFNDADFPIEMAQTNGTTAHAIERLLWAFIQRAGFKVTSFEALPSQKRTPPISMLLHTS